MVEARLTFVIPAYKSAATIGRTLQSVLREAPGSAAIVVFDGPDPEAERQVPSHPDIQVIVRSQNAGACAARNLGLSHCKSDYVMFLDADDMVEGGLPANAVRAGDQRRADLVFSDFIREYPGGQRSCPQHPGRATDPAQLFAEWMRGVFVSPCAIVWRSAFVRQIGGWNEVLAQNQDGEIIYRALAARPTVAWNETGYGVYLEHPDFSRVSFVMKDKQVESQFIALGVAEKLNAEHRLVDPATVGIAYYRLARRFYGRGLPGPGHRALARARALGFKGHFGDRMHRVLAAAAGLRGKVVITQAVRNLHNTLRGRGRSFRTRRL